MRVSDADRSWRVVQMQFSPMFWVFPRASLEPKGGALVKACRLCCSSALFTTAGSVVFGFVVAFIFSRTRNVTGTYNCDE